MEKIYPFNDTSIKYLKNKKVVSRMIRTMKEEMKSYYIDISKYIFHAVEDGSITAIIEARCKDNHMNCISLSNVYYNKKTGEILESVLEID
jgi:hypothetical protein